jgi:hypothetical protein
MRVRTHQPESWYSNILLGKGVAKVLIPPSSSIPLVQEAAVSVGYVNEVTSSNTTSVAGSWRSADIALSIRSKVW